MTPLVLLPGMMCDARLFAAQTGAISARRAVINAPIGAHADMEALARDVLAAGPERFALAGLSMGGIVAMEMLRQAPDRIERLALLDTNPLAERDEVKARRGPQIAAVRAGGLRAVMRDELKPNYLVDSPLKPAILDLCMDMAEALGADVFENQSLALRDRPDQSATLSKVTVPTLILCGAEDRLCPVERHELMQDLVAGSTLTVIKGAGHLPTLEKPEETTAALLRWLDQPA